MMRQLRRDSGFGLLHVLLIVVIVTGLSASTYTWTLATRQSVAIYVSKVQATSSAESAVEAAGRELALSVSEGTAVPMAGQVELGGRLATWSLGPLGARVLTTDGTTGLSFFSQNYRIVGDGVANRIRSRVIATAQVREMPIFQFLAYYRGDLELIPAQSASYDGRLYSTGDMYVGAGAAIALQTAYLRAAGRIFRRTKEGVPTTGTVTIRNKLTGNQVSLPSKSDLATAGVPSVSGFDSDFLGFDADADGMFDGPDDQPPFTLGSQMRFGGSVLLGDHGIKEFVGPSITDLDRMSYVGTTGGDYTWNQLLQEYLTAIPVGTGTHDLGYFAAEADLRIIDGQPHDRSGASLGSLLSGPLTTTRMIYDARQGATIAVQDLDISKIPAEMWPTNGLIYVARSGASGSDPAGVVLSHGDKLKSDLTVVSQNPVYIHGDYNEDGKKSAAVMADAVNVLSSAFDFSKTPGTLPIATRTKICAAIVSGDVPTTASAYSGGYENLFRLHENWTGVTLEFRGAVARLWPSKLAIAPFQSGGDSFQPPTHAWTYDPRFDDSELLPPFTPYVVDVVFLVWDVDPGYGPDDVGVITGVPGGGTTPTSGTSGEAGLGR